MDIPAVISIPDLQLRVRRQAAVDLPYCDWLKLGKAGNSAPIHVSGVHHRTIDDKSLRPAPPRDDPFGSTGTMFTAPKGWNFPVAPRSSSKFKTAPSLTKLLVTYPKRPDVDEKEHAVTYVGTKNLHKKANPKNPQKSGKKATSERIKAEERIEDSAFDWTQHLTDGSDLRRLMPAYAITIHKSQGALTICCPAIF